MIYWTADTAPYDVFVGGSTSGEQTLDLCLVDDAEFDIR